MKIIRRTILAGAVTVAAVVGLAGGASAVEYTPDVVPNTDVQGAQVSQTDVANAAAVDSAGTLPYTGNDSSLPLAEIGAGLLAAGGLMVVVVRRRQADAA